MPWTKQQQLAIDKKNGNILVAASAGSGKTAVLVERIINKIINENVDIDRLLIVTFTKAAASEMKERILKAIYDRLEESPDNLHLQKQLININKATITTMDSFFLEIVKSNFFECGLDPNISVCTDMQKYAFKEEALDEIIEEEFEKEDNDKFNTVYEIIADGKDDEFKNKIYQLYNYIQSFPYPYIWLKEQIERYNIEDDLMKNKLIKIIYNNTLEELRNVVNNLENAIDMVSYDEQLCEKYTARFEKDINDVEICIKNSLDIDTLYENLRAGVLAEGMPIIRGALNPELKEAASGIRKKCKDTVEALRKNIYAKGDVIKEDLIETYGYLMYIYDIIIRLNEKMLDKKKEKNILDFSDIAHTALNLLVTRREDNFGNEILDETEVAKRYKERFDEIYIDEYQDSNYVQEYVLSAISKKTEDNPNQFMVGDIKQSIYGFRQAMPEIFLDKYENYSTEEDSDYTKIILAKNFRSRKEVLEPINYIFSQIMTRECGNCSYVGDERLVVGADYKDDETTDYSMEVDVMDIVEDKEREIKDNEEKLENISIEAKFIANRIKEIVDGNEEKNILPMNVYNVKSKAENKFRKAEYRDIVILLRGGIKKEGKIIEEELKKNNIPVFCDGNSSLLDSDEVNFILTFLELLDNWYQDIPLIAVMYSIIGKFTLEELVKIRKNHKEGYFFDALLDTENLEEDLKLKINNFLEIIYKYTYISKYFKISELLLHLYEETGIYEQFLIKEGGVQKCANLDALVELATSFETTDYKGLYQFIDYAKDLKESKEKGMDAKIIGESENVVRIMTVHKSKGLEFPIVILACANKGFNMADINQNEIVLNEELGIGVNVIKDNKEFITSYPSVIKNAIKQQNKKKLVSEELRLLYVALTRAKEKLIITGAEKSFEKKSNSKLYIKDDKTGIIDSSCIFSLTNYLDIIMLTLREYDKSKSDAKINVNIIKEENISEIEEETSEEENIYSKWEEFVNEVEIDKEEEDKLISALDFEYAFKDAVEMQGKYTVSEIKRMHIEEENLDTELGIEKLNKPPEEMYKVDLKIPRFMAEKIEYSAAQRGTLIHKVFENIDFESLDQDGIDGYINYLIKNRIILEEEKKYINKYKFKKFMDSDLFAMIKDAKEVEKEKAFVYRKKANELTATFLDEYILIQGIIDLYFITKEDKVILVDYKTDRLEEESLFIERYKVQLDLYKEAIEKTTGKEVEKVYIYSLYLGKEIEIK